MSGKGKFTKKAQAKGNFQAKGGSNIACHSIKKSVNNYNYYLGSAKQASDYENTTEYLINYIKKVFDYGSGIGTALESLEPMSTMAWLEAKYASEHCNNRRRSRCGESTI